MKASQLLLLVAAVSLTGVVRADEPAWITLFDGQTLTGWTQHIVPAPPDNRPEAEKKSKPTPCYLLPDDKRGKVKFVVEDGCIVGHAEKNPMHSYLCTDKEYGDFDFECEVLVGAPKTGNGGMNSGIQIRSLWDVARKDHAYPVVTLCHRV